MASAAVQNKTPRKVLKKSTRDSLIAYSFIAPNFIGFCVFTLVPMVFAIALAFCAWDGRHAIEFIGLKNFVKLFTTDKIFQAALKNTVVYVIGTVPLTLACSLAMAVLLNQNVKLRNFLPHGGVLPLRCFAGGGGSGVEHDLQPLHGPHQHAPEPVLRRGGGKPAPLGCR